MMFRGHNTNRIYGLVIEHFRIEDDEQEAEKTGQIYCKDLGHGPSLAMTHP